MAIAVHQTYNVDLQKGAIEKSGESLVRGNQYAHTYHVKLTNGGDSVSVEGVEAVFNRADGASVSWSDTVETDGVSVTLTPECYAIAGNSELFVNVTHGDSKLTVLHLTMYIDFGAKDAIVDPGHVIPDIKVLLAEVENMRAATQNATEAATAAANVVQGAQDAKNEALDAAQVARNAAEDFAGNGVRVSTEAEPVVVQLPTWNEHHALEQRVDGMTSLPNPFALTFTGAVKATYDGSSAVSVNIPSGGGGGEGGSGADGATFRPSVSEDGVLSWTNDKGLENPPDANIKGAKGDRGEQGIRYIPEVSEDGVLSWTNTGYAENPPAVNIKGVDAEIDSTLTKSGKAADAKIVGDKFTAVNNKIGNLSTLQTAEKTSIVAAVNETFQSVSEGKSALASALADKGQTVDAGATFAAFANAIRAIAGGGGGSIDIDGVEVGSFKPEDVNHYPTNGNINTVYVPHNLGVVPKYAACIIIDSQSTAEIVFACIMVSSNGSIDRGKSTTFVRRSGGTYTVDGLVNPADNRLRMTSTEVSFAYGQNAPAQFPKGYTYLYVIQKG